MWFSQLRNPVLGRRFGRLSGPRHRGVRLVLEPLEDRLVLSNFTASSVPELIADIRAAHKAGGSNTITLQAGTAFTLTAVNNTTDGATGLPVIKAKDQLTIVGNGDTIARSTAAGTPPFRLFDVASGASLTLENLTVQGGLAMGSGVAAEGRHLQPGHARPQRRDGAEQHRPGPGLLLRGCQWWWHLVERIADA
jgi:hypothetical protein